MERFRIEWRQGPRLIAREAWVIDLELLASKQRGPFLVVKHLQVVAAVDELTALGLSGPDQPEPGWDFWRALVAVAAGSVIRSIATEELHFDRPHQPYQLAPDPSEAARRAAEMPVAAVESSELVLSFAG
jgi:hypothetical protein